MLCPLLISAWGKKTFLVHHSYEKDDFSVSDTGSLEEKNANYNRSRSYELLPLSLTEKSSFSYIHQAQNSPSHLYHLRCGFNTLQCRKDLLCFLIILLISLFHGYVHVPSCISCTTGATCNNIIPSLSQSLMGL